MSPRSASYLNSASELAIPSAEKNLDALSLVFCDKIVSQNSRLSVVCCMTSASEPTSAFDSQFELFAERLNSQLTFSSMLLFVPKPFFFF